MVWCGDTGRRDTAGDTHSQPEAECPCPGDTADQQENMCPCSAADTVDQWEHDRTPGTQWRQAEQRKPGFGAKHIQLNIAFDSMIQ